MSIRALVRTVPERWRQASSWTADGVLAVVFFGIGLLTTSGSTGEAPGTSEPRNAVAIALIAASTIPFVARRRAPLPVFVATCAALAALMVCRFFEGALPLIVVVGAYTVGAYRPARELVVATMAWTVAVVVVLIAPNPTFGFGELVIAATMFATAAVLGWSVQGRRQRLEALDAEQAEAARRAAADERLRIAQELHDVVAHSLGVIAVQAGVGLHTIDVDPAEARRALDNISRTSRSSLAEIRRLLGMVRNREGGDAYAPAPRLADLSRLVQDMADTGLPIDLRMEGDTAGVPAGVELAVYRIVQESLTNALRHAKATRAAVSLHSDAGVLRVEITDDGVGGNGSGPRQGHGLVGMRERAAMYGGSLEAGPRLEGGFGVAVCLPYEAEPIT